MAMVLRANRMTNSESSPVPVESYEPLHRQNGSTSSSPPRSASPSSNHEDSFRRMIFDKVEEGKRDVDPQKCTKILEDLMKMLKHLTADVNNYNLAFRETRPAFYMQVRNCLSPSSFSVHRSSFIVLMKEFQRLTDRIEILTQARDNLNEYLHEVENQNLDVFFPSSSPVFDGSTSSGTSLPHSPLEKTSHQQKSSGTPIPSNAKDIIINDYSTATDPVTHQHSYPLSSPVSTHMSSQQAHYQYSRSRSPSMTPSNFIRVHFPNKHTTAVSPSTDPIGFVKSVAIILAFAPQRWNTRSRTRISSFTPFSD